MARTLIYVRIKPPLADNVKGGVTLLEALVALTLLSMTAAIATASITSSLPNAKLRIASERLTDDLKHARLAAMRDGHTVSVRISQGGYAVLPNINTRHLPAGVAFDMSASSRVIQFQPDGWSEGGVFFVESKTEDRSVRVSPVTGKIVLNHERSRTN